MRGRADRPFPFPRSVAARAPADYWQRARHAHEALGLVIRDGECVAWPVLTPAGPWEIFLLSPTLDSGAALCHRMIRALAPHVGRGFSLSAHPAPPCPDIESHAGPFALWPPVVWRLRGARPTPDTDLDPWGGDAFQVDPFLLMHWLTGAISW